MLTIEEQIRRMIEKTNYGEITLTIRNGKVTVIKETKSHKID